MPSRYCATTLFVHDSGSGTRFLVDSGADVSVLPATPAEMSRRSSEPLMAANGSSIRTYGTAVRRIKLRGHTFKHRFILAAVNKPILGADFFTQHRLLIDLAGRRLLRSATSSSPALVVRAHPASVAAYEVGLHEVRSSPFEAVLDEFPEILTPQFGDYMNAHGVRHHIPTTGAPIHARPRRLGPAQLSAAKKNFFKMIDQEICRPSKSAWSSPLHMVPKPDGSWRPC